MNRTSNSLNVRVNFTIITFSVTFITLCIIQDDPHGPTQMAPTQFQLWECSIADIMTDGRTDGRPVAIERCIALAKLQHSNKLVNTHAHISRTAKKITVLIKVFSAENSQITVNSNVLTDARSLVANVSQLHKIRQKQDHCEV